jgi:hypothetical protein
MSNLFLSSFAPDPYLSPPLGGCPRNWPVDSADRDGFAALMALALGSNSTHFLLILI